MRLKSSGPEETAAIGFRLGSMLRPGDIVGLYGDLGAGKTTLVKGIASALGVDSRDVTSASYTIIAEYPVDPPFVHADLYRLGGSDDVENTGLWDYIGKDSISVIEWAEKLGEAPPCKLIRVCLEDKGNDMREITIEGMDEKDRCSL